MQAGDGGAAVFVVMNVVDGRGVAERRTVVTGRRVVDGWIEIESGLNVGDVLIADPPVDLDSGDRVRVMGEQTNVGDTRG